MLFRSRKLSLSLAVLSLSYLQSFAVDTVTLLDRTEPYSAMTARNGVFWVGHSRKQFNVDFRIESYTPEGQLIATAPLRHSLLSIKPIDFDKVIITGVNPSTRLTEYTIAQLENGVIVLRTNQIDLGGGFINFWIGTLGNRAFFADVGGNPNDTSTDLQQPGQTIFYSTGSNTIYLKNRVSMPVAGLALNNK